MSGPHYFAWVDAGEAFDPGIHLREDEQILTVKLSQSEGEFASLSIEIVNPRVGLLAPGRKVWCWYSWDRGDTVLPMLKGRLVAIPSNLHAETITLEFIAKPINFADQKAALAATMRTLPYYDPVFVNNNDAAKSDDTVLEAYAQLWDIDRISLAVSATDIIAGGTLIEITEALHFYNDMTVNILKAPIVACDISATLQFQQTGNGSINVTHYIADSHGILGTVTAGGLISSWPKPGSEIGGGWSWDLQSYALSATDREADKNLNFNWFFNSIGQFGTGFFDPWLEAKELIIPYVDPPQPDQPIQVTAISEAQGEDQPFSVTITSPKYVALPFSSIKVNAILDWKADRIRTEIIHCTVTADVQSVFTDPDTSEREKIELTAPSAVDQPIDFGGAVPLIDTRLPSYLKTERGQQTVQYILLLARAKLLSGARVVEIVVKTPWVTAAQLNCRTSIRILDRRLPAGQAVGKITSYQLTAEGGAETAEIKIGCTVGYGNTVSAVEGTNTYSDGTYDLPGYEVEIGGTIALTTGDIVYQSFDEFQIVDDGLNFLNFNDDQAVIDIHVIPAVIPPQFAAPPPTLAVPTPNPMQILEDNPTKVHIELKPVAGSEFVQTFTPTISPLMVPQTIDLEAS